MLPALEKENKENDDKYTEIRMETKEAGKKDAVVEIGIKFLAYYLLQFKPFLSGY